MKVRKGSLHDACTDWSRQAEVLGKQLGLTPYESRAFISLLIHGPMSPSKLAQLADVPRPRVYDVLRSLEEKGLIIERFGKPSIYTAVEPAEGLRNLLVKIERETLRQLKEKRRVIERVTKPLSQMYEKSKELKLERGKVWFTRRDTTYNAIFIEAIRSYKRELLVTSTDTRPPEKEILEAVKRVLRIGKSVRVVRQITNLWTLEELERYQEIIKAGSQVRHLNIKEIPLRFSTFDDKEIILVFPPESKSAMSKTVEALWLRIPSLAKILRWHFEELWKKGEPSLPILKKIEKKAHIKTNDKHEGL